MKGFWKAVASAGPYTNNLHLALRQLTTSTPHHSVFIGRMLFLTPNQQCQSTEGNWYQHLVLTYCIVNITQLKTLITYH